MGTYLSKGKSIGGGGGIPVGSGVIRVAHLLAIVILFL
jgi:hypothetical protein